MPKGEKIGGLWDNQKDGNVYMRGRIGDQKVIIFHNGFKKESKHPDWIVYEDLPMAGGGTRADSTPAIQPRYQQPEEPAKQAYIPGDTYAADESDDIPF